MHIIFDLYGTLYQPGLNLMSIVKKISDVLELPYPDEAQVYGMLNKDMDEYLEVLYPQVKDKTELKKLFTIYEKEHAHGGDIVAGMKEVLLKLKEQGHYLSICSTGPEAFIETVLAENGITNCFDLTLSARVFIDKGEAIKTVLRPNQDALIVGDTIADFLAAIKNHIPSIGVNHGFGADDDFSAATFRAKEPKDILTLIKRIEEFASMTKELTRNKENDTIIFSGVKGTKKSSIIFDYARYINSLGLKAEILRLETESNFSSEFENIMQNTSKLKSNVFDYAQADIYFSEFAKLVDFLPEEKREGLLEVKKEDIICLVDLI